MTLLTDKADLQHSTQSRSGTPDGNYFLDTSVPATPVIQIFSAAEVPTMAGAVPNLLDASDGVTMKALYGAIGVLRRTDDTIRHFLKPSVGVYANAGAYKLLNNYLFDTSTDWKLVRGAGLECYNVAEQLNRVYFGPKSSGNIELASQPSFQTVANGAVTSFTFTGDVDELVQVYGTTANGDTGAGNFDLRSFFAVSVREWSYRHDRKSLVDSQLEEAAGYAGGFGLGESEHPSTGDYTEANVHTAAIAPFSTMNFLTEAAPVTRSGFNEADGDFAMSIENPAGGTLAQVVAKADAWARDVADIDSGTPTREGIQHPVLYTFGPGDIIEWAQGIYPENIPGSELTSMTVTDDAGNVKTFPDLLTVTVYFSDAAKADANAWYEVFLEDDEDTANDYNTSAALTYQDKDSAAIVGTVSGANSTSFDVNFSIVPPGSTWEAGETHVIRIVVGGDPNSAGGPEENFVLQTIDGTQKSISVTVTNNVETNV